MTTYPQQVCPHAILQVRLLQTIWRADIATLKVEAEQGGKEDHGHWLLVPDGSSLLIYFSIN